MSGVTTITDAIGVLETTKQAVEAEIGHMTEITGWCDEQLGALATGGLAEGELAQAVELFKSRAEGLAGGLSEINHALEGAMQVGQLVASH